MDDRSPAEKAQTIQISTGDEMSRGRYSNNMIASHSADEFILDWLLNAPNGAHLVARLIVSPAHLKRIIAALQVNLDKYEQQFGSVQAGNSADHKFH